MKAFDMNDTDTVVALDEAAALNEIKRVYGFADHANYTEAQFLEEYDIVIVEITDLENTFCYFGAEDENDLYDVEKMKGFRISFKELIERYEDQCPIHFTTEI